MESINVMGPACACGSAGGGQTRRESRFDHGSRKHTNMYTDGGRRAPAGSAVWPEPVLSVRGLRCQLDGETVLDDVSFDIAEGAAFGLTGSAGATAPADMLSRTALVRVVCGLRAADRGSVLVGGCPVDGAEGTPLRDAVGYVAHSVASASSMTVTGTVRMWARQLGLAGPLGRERTAEVLALVRIEAHAAARVDRCPAGVLREMSLAVALLRQPRLLVLDEPMRGINPRGQERLRKTLDRIRGGGTALLYAAANPAEVREVCDRVGVLHHGRLVTRDDVESPRILTAA